VDELTVEDSVQTLPDLPPVTGVCLRANAKSVIGHDLFPRGSQDISLLISQIPFRPYRRTMVAECVQVG
jgi:hypothetical protein